MGSYLTKETKEILRTGAGRYRPLEEELIDFLDGWSGKANSINISPNPCKAANTILNRDDNIEALEVYLKARAARELKKAEPLSPLRDEIDNLLEDYHKATYKRRSDPDDYDLYAQGILSARGDED